MTMMIDDQNIIMTIYVTVQAIVKVTELFTLCVLNEELIGRLVILNDTVLVL
jgi:hypothetical protein